MTNNMKAGIQPRTSSLADFNFYAFRRLKAKNVKEIDDDSEKVVASLLCCIITTQIICRVTLITVCVGVQVWVHVRQGECVCVYVHVLVGNTGECVCVCA